VDGNRRRIASSPRLYGGDGRVRIRQELLLGVGGYRALKARHHPGVLHLNEGHSGFGASDPHVCRMKASDLMSPSPAARELVFTTHAWRWS
jgi:starch phosphorylase